MQPVYFSVWPGLVKRQTEKWNFLVLIMKQNAPK